MDAEARTPPRAYSGAQWASAVLLAALFGWAAFVLPMLARVLLDGDRNATSLLLTMAAFGLPVALVIALVFVAYPLRIMMRRPVSYARAIKWALGISSGLAALSIVIGRLNGLRISRDPNFSSQIGGGDYVRSVDGILTPYGWWVLAQNTATFVLSCVLAALLIRAIIGPGRASVTSGEANA